MNTTDVFGFIADLGKCYHNPFLPIKDYTYNGIHITQGAETYEIVLQDKFARFKAAVCEMSEVQRRLVLEELKAAEGQYFDVPDDEIIARMQQDYERSLTEAFRDEITMARFALDMCRIQKRFIAEGIDFVNRLIPMGTETDGPQPTTVHSADDTEQQTEQQIEQKQIKTESDKEVISGTRGLAEHLGCGKTMAFSIIKSGKLIEVGIQYKVGNCWKFNARRLDKYIAEHPELLANVRCKSVKNG